MCLARTRRRFCSQLLAGIWRVAAASSICITTDIAVGVADVVSIFLIELVVRHIVEALPPEHQRLLERQTDAFEEERILQTAKMLEVGVFGEGDLKVAHTEWEVLGEAGDGIGSDRGTRHTAVARVVIGAAWGGEVLGEMVEDGRKAVVFVQTGKCACSELVCGVSECEYFSFAERTSNA